MSTEPQSVRDCTDRDRLVYAYEIALADYKRAVAVIQWARGKPSREDHERLLKYIDEAQVKSEEARSALDTHIDGHGC